MKLRSLLAAAMGGLALALRVVWLYNGLRLRLWWWRRRWKRAFSKQVEGLPPELRRSLEREYRALVDKWARLPGLQGTLRLLHRTRAWRRGG